MNGTDYRQSDEGRIFLDQLVTKADLRQFKEELLEALSKNQGTGPVKKWLKSSEVKKMLHISTGTLQNLRASGSIPFTKMGGLLFYDAEAINRILSGKISESRIVLNGIPKGYTSKKGMSGKPSQR